MPFLSNRVQFFSFLYHKNNVLRALNLMEPAHFHFRHLSRHNIIHHRFKILIFQPLGESQSSLRSEKISCNCQFRCIHTKIPESLSQVFFAEISLYSFFYMFVQAYYKQGHSTVGYVLVSFWDFFIIGIDSLVVSRLCCFLSLPF